MLRQPPMKSPLPTNRVPGTYSDNADEPYTNGDPATGTEGSIPPFEAVDHPQYEIVNVIKAAAITPSHTDLTQLLQAIRRLFKTEVTLTNDGTGVAMYGGQTVDFAHKIRSVKAGTGISVALEADGPNGAMALRIVNTAPELGGGGGGAAAVTSGQGVTIAGDNSANLAFQNLTNSDNLDDTDLFAFFNQTEAGLPAGHYNMTWAQLRARIAEMVTERRTATLRLSGSVALTDGIGSVIGPFAVDLQTTASPIASITGNRVYPVAGNYLISGAAKVYFSHAAAAGQIVPRFGFLSLYKNGALIAEGGATQVSRIGQTGVGSVYPTIPPQMITIAAGDYIEAVAVGTTDGSGVAATIQALLSQTFFTLDRVV